MGVANTRNARKKTKTHEFTPGVKDSKGRNKNRVRAAKKTAATKRRANRSYATAYAMKGVYGVAETRRARKKTGIKTKPKKKAVAKTKKKTVAKKIKAAHLKTGAKAASASRKVRNPNKKKKSKSKSKSKSKKK